MGGLWGATTLLLDSLTSIGLQRFGGIISSRDKNHPRLTNEPRDWSGTQLPSSASVYKMSLHVSAPMLCSLETRDPIQKSVRQHLRAHRVQPSSKSAEMQDKCPAMAAGYANEHGAHSAP